MGSLLKSKTSAQSTNPAWFDNAGQEIYNFAKDLVFQPSQPSGGTGTPSAQPAAQPTGTSRYPWLPADAKANQTFGYSGPVGGATDGGGGGGSTPGPMSMDNLRPMQKYDPTRDYGLTPNQQQASDVASAGVGKMQGYLDNASNYATGATASYGQTYNPTDVTARDVNTGAFNMAEAERYMSPFAKMALDPVRDELERNAAIERNRLKNVGPMRSAFGGSRGYIQENEVNRDLMDKTSALYSTGLAGAYDRAMSGYQTDAARALQAATSNQGKDVSLGTFNEGQRLQGFNANRDQFNTETQRKLAAAELMNTLANTKSNIISQNVDRLMRTGAQDYEAFAQERDYPNKQLETLLSVLNGSGAKGSVQNVQQPSAFSQIAGLGLAAAGAAGGM